MSTYRYPSIFLSHGTPMLAFGEDANQEMLSQFSKSMPKPKAVLFLSAHSVSSDSIHVLKTQKNTIIHDFTGFPKALYEVNYECPGDPELSEKVAQLLMKAGFQTKLDQDGPLDHGIWVPMLHLYPKGNVPVVRVSLPLNMTPAQILKMGHTLSSLREEGIMLVGTGGAVHNLRQLKWTNKTEAGADWAQNFEDWLIEKLSKKDVDSLVNAEEHPAFYQAHPTAEHFSPLLFTIGAALPNDQFKILQRGIEYHTLSMLCFALNHEQAGSLH